MVQATAPKNSNNENSDAAARATAADEIFLVDGSGYIFRAFFALPQNLTNPHGVAVGAVLGFCNMLQKLLTDIKAPYIAVIFDAARENFRNDIYKDYKANRDETPEDLIPQFPLIREATKAFGIPALEKEGFEADDLIAAYAAQARAQGRKVTIVGTDKDLMQLVNDDVRLYDPIKNRYLGAAHVIEKFGVPPEKVIDVQALAGDSTDNIPGVPGIGVKTAAQLIEEYGDLESLLARAEEIKQPKRREKLIENAEMARISKKLVTLDTNAPLPLAIEDLKAHDPELPKLTSFLEEQGFKALLARLGRKAAPGDSAPERRSQDQNEQTPAPALPPIDENEYVLINDAQTLQKWIDRAYETGQLAIDTETTGLTPAKADLVGISLCAEPGRAAYIPLAHRQEKDLLDNNTDNIVQMDIIETLALLGPLLTDESVIKIGHNMKYDWQIIAAHDVEMTPCDDTMLMSYVLDNTAHGHGMDELAQLFCDHKTIKFSEIAGTGKKQVSFDYVAIDQALTYAAEDAEITMRLYKILKPRIAQERMASVYEDIERPLIPIIARMEMAGVKVDPSVLKTMSQDFAARRAALEKEIHKAAGHEFNIASPRQIGTVLFDELGLKGGKKTKGGDWSTASDILESLAAEGHDIVRKILDWRQISKLKSTYTDALAEQINPKTGRIHTSFHMTGTSTGRLASSDPNLQNIPIRTEDGRKIRKAFIADKDHVLLSVDYSQVELRLTAEMAGVKSLQKAFQDQVDIHALTAAQVFGVPQEEVTPELRRQAKAVNFGIIYGISGWGLAKQLGCEPAEANSFIRTYLSRFPEIQDYMERNKEEARQNGFVKTLYGRKIIIHNINSKVGNLRQGAERQAINAPLQGTAADIMKRAMAKMPRALAEAGLSATMLLQVHDELIFEVPKAELDQTAEIVRTTMENVARLNVPLTAETGSGLNWDEAH